MLNVQFELNKNTFITILLTDINGRIIQTAEKSFVQGNQQITLPMHGFAQGVYVLKIN